MTSEEINNILMDVCNKEQEMSELNNMIDAINNLKATGEMQMEFKDSSGMTSSRTIHMSDIYTRQTIIMLRDYCEARVEILNSYINSVRIVKE